MPVLNPWLQRLLIGLLGGTTTASALVVTAKDRYAPKKKKKKRVRRPDDSDEGDGAVATRQHRPPPPAIALGTVAKADAAEEFVPSMTWAQWTAGVRQRGRRLVDVLLGRSGKPVVDDDGARLADEVVTADGQRVRPAQTAAKTKTTKKKTQKKTTAQKGRRRGRRRQATLFESAKESLRQVVKEEVKKTVDDTVEQTGLKGAVDTIKEASDNVGEVAKDVAQKIKDALPEDAGEKIQSGARSFFAGAKKQAARLRDSIQASLDEAAAASEQRRVLEEAAEERRALEAAATPPPDDDVIDMIDGEAALTPTLPETASSIGEVDTTAEGASASTSTALMRPEPTALQPIEDIETPREGLTAADVANKVNDGVAKLGSFLVGPGHPDYGANKRRRAASGDVVEAKDPTATGPGTDPTGTD